MQRNTPVVPCMKSPLPERKEHGTPRPHTPRQVRSPAPRQTEFAVFIKIVWCRCFASAAVQPRRLVVRSTKSPAGAVQSAQWRELDLSSSRAPAKFPVVMRCPVGSRNFVPRPLAVGTIDGGKNMRAPRPHTLRQVRITCTPANKFAVFIKTVWCRCSASAAVQRNKLLVLSLPDRQGKVGRGHL